MFQSIIYHFGLCKSTTMAPGQAPTPATPAPTPAQNLPSTPTQGQYQYSGWLAKFSKEQVFIQSQPMLVAMCHSHKVDRQVELPHGHSLVTYTEDGARLPVQDAKDAMIELLLNQGSSLPEQIAGFPIKSTSGD